MNPTSDNYGRPILYRGIDSRGLFVDVCDATRSRLLLKNGALPPRVLLGGFGVFKGSPWTLDHPWTKYARLPIPFVAWYRAEHLVRYRPAGQEVMAG